MRGMCQLIFSFIPLGFGCQDLAHGWYVSKTGLGMRLKGLVDLHWVD